jgi:hypothetical protein
MLLIDDNGLATSEYTIFDRTNSKSNYFDFIIQKEGFENIDSIIAENFEVIKGQDLDTIRFFDKQFKIINHFYFSENNLKINKDSTEFKLTNKHRVNNDSKGLSVSNSEFNMEIGIGLPQNFEITKVKSFPSTIEIFQEKNIVVFSGEKIDDFIYEINFKKNKIDTSYKQGDKNEIIRKKIPIEKMFYEIEIWDNQNEDDDIINVYFNDKLVLNELRVSKTPLKLPLDLRNAKKDILIVHFESVSEGRIKPNTVKLRVFGNNLDQTIDLITDKKTNSIIEFIINQEN